MLRRAVVFMWGTRVRGMLAGMKTASEKPAPRPDRSAIRSESFVSAIAYSRRAGNHPHATGTFSWILSALSISTKIIADKVRRARLENVLGSVGQENVQGEVQQKLDVIANEVLLATLGGREGVAIVASEENEEPVILREDQQGVRRYCVLFDPLDGSSNLDICGGVGTIFSILSTTIASSRRAIPCCSPASSKSPRATCCTAPRRCSC
jgi:fructose-1,6-bisphosphatase I